MKIAIPMLGFGRAGGYRVLSQLASHWSDGGHDVVMLANRCSPRPYFPTSCRVMWIDGLGRATDWTGPTVRGRLAGKCHVVGQLFALRAALSRYCRRCDVIMANHSLTALPVRYCHSDARKFYYIQAYEPEYYALRPGWSSAVVARLSALSYRLKLRQIVNGHVYCDHPAIRSNLVVPPGVDETLFRPAHAPAQRDPRRLVIGCIGRSEIGKGTRYVVEAFRLLRAAGHRHVLRVAYGNLPESCRGLPGVEVIMPASDADLADYYRSVDVMVAPGTVQLGAFHYPVMEAMACGVPVITTGYAPATPENAWIVPVHDAQGIAEAIVEAARRPEMVAQRVRRAAEAIKPFAWPSVAASMLSIFREAPQAA